jgi:DNA polymerase I
VKGYAGSKELIKAYEQEDADFHQAVADMANIPRSQAKTINLGIMYGMGINKLAKELGIPKVDAEAIVLQYKQKVPFVQKLAEKVMSVADSRGYIYTLLGRQCRFNFMGADNVWIKQSYERRRCSAAVWQKKY